MSAAHTHANIELNYIFEGQVTYMHGGVQQTVESGRLAMFWAGVPHQTLTPAETGKGIWTMLPLAWFLQWKLPRDFAGRLLAGEFFQFEIAPDLPVRWLDHFTSDDPDRRSLLLLELHATIAGLAFLLPPPLSQTSRAPEITSGGEFHIPRITAYIATHYHDENLTSEAIARELNLRPKYLKTLFKRQCRVGLWEYINRLRVSHAQRLLATTDLRVLDVALESGFSSLASFYNAFTRYCGIRPLTFRKQQGQTKTESKPTSPWL